MDFIEWYVLLSYDAPKELYNLVNEELDFTTLTEEEKEQFRVILLAVLIHLGAKNIESSVESTVAFHLTLPEDFDPISHVCLFLDSFFEGDNFAYMIQATNYSSLYAANRIKEQHIEEFEDDYSDAKELYKRVKKRL